MKKVNLNDLQWEERSSPKGRFRMRRKQISIALGNQPHAGPYRGGHPFEVELSCVPPGADNWPLHAHTAQHEFYIILSGTGVHHGQDGDMEVGPGDCFISGPDDPHSLTNTGGEDLVYYVIADNQPADIVRYPDSGKWFIKPQRMSFRMQEADYYDGEE